MLLQLSYFFLPFIPLHPVPPLPLSFPDLSSCPWVIHVSSLASSFPILFLTSPCLFCTYHVCFLLPLPSPHSTPTPSPLITFHVIFISVICSCSSSSLTFFFFGAVVDNCEFVVVLLFVFLMFFFLDKSF